MTLLLILSCITFISIGLPNAMLGSAWPVMYLQLQVPIGSAGIISMLISGSTIVSGLVSARLIRRFGRITVISACKALMAVTLLGFALSRHFAVLCLLAVPLGLGSGAIDTGVSSFVALHYKARHMNWLHAFWAVGATIGPLIMSFSLIRFEAWQGGYIIVAILQLLLAAVLIFTVPLWNRVDQLPEHVAAVHDLLPLKHLARMAGAVPTLVALFMCCGIETTVGLWGSSYLVKARGLPEETAASWIALYFTGIMAGRFLSGLLSIRLNNRQLIELGELLIAAGVTMLFLPLPDTLLLAALFLIGLGLAPIVPSMLHSTPAHFGGRYAQSLIGVQMASTFAGSALVPPLFGYLAGEARHHLFPYFLAAVLIVMVLAMALVYHRLNPGAVPAATD